MDTLRQYVASLPDEDRLALISEFPDYERTGKLAEDARIRALAQAYASDRGMSENLWTLMNFLPFEAYRFYAERWFEGPADGWRSMETVPRDGRPLLLDLGDAVVLAHWFKPWECYVTDPSQIDPAHDDYAGIGADRPRAWRPVPVPASVEPAASVIASRSRNWFARADVARSRLEADGDTVAAALLLDAGDTIRDLDAEADRLRNALENAAIALRLAGLDDAAEKARAAFLLHS